MCPAIPWWFIGLAIWGAVSATGLIGFMLLGYLAHRFAEKDEERIENINRRIFGE